MRRAARHSHPPECLKERNRMLDLEEKYLDLESRAF